MRPSALVKTSRGRDLGEVFDRHPAATDQVMLRVEDIHSDVHRGVSFEVHAGEIVGFAGLIGAGRSELAKVIFGEMPMASGRVEVDGREVTIRQPADAIRQGIGFAPEDRKRARSGCIWLDKRGPLVSVVNTCTIITFKISGGWVGN